MDTQAIFDKVVQHLLTQRRRAEKETGVCQYRGPFGTKCAIGCLITDENYKTDLETKTISQVKVRSAVEDSIGRPLTQHDLTLLKELQFIHDNADVYDWQNQLKEAATGYKLTFNPPE